MFETQCIGFTERVAYTQNNESVVLSSLLLPKPFPLGMWRSILQPSQSCHPVHCDTLVLAFQQPMWRLCLPFPMESMGIAGVGSSSALFRKGTQVTAPPCCVFSCSLLFSPFLAIALSQVSSASFSTSYQHLSFLPSLPDSFLQPKATL